MKKIGILVVLVAVLAIVALPVWAVEYTGIIDGTEPTQVGRLNRNSIQSTCASPKAFASVFDPGTNFHYDTHSYTNTSGAVECVLVEFNGLNSTANIMVGAWLGSFNPADISVNYLADGGFSTGVPPNPVSFSFNLNPGETAIIGVMDTNNATDSQYSLTVGPYVPPTVLNVPHVTDIQINAGANVPAYVEPGGEQVKLSSGVDLFLPHDYDGNGFDTYIVTATQEGEDGTIWYSIFLGSEEFVWVNGNLVTPLN